MDPLELLASHAIPVQKHHSKLSGAPVLKVQDVPAGKLVKAAGNAMSVPCIGAFILCAIMCVEPRSFPHRS